MNNLVALGDEEGDVRVGRQMIKAAGGRPGNSGGRPVRQLRSRGL